MQTLRYLPLHTLLSLLRARLHLHLCQALDPHQLVAPLFLSLLQLLASISKLTWPGQASSIVLLLTLTFVLGYGA